MRTRNIIDIFFIGRTGRPANQLNITPDVTRRKRNIYGIVGVLLAVLSAVSCAKDEDTVTLRAVMADIPSGGQKVYIDDQRYACWENGDKVAVNGNPTTVTVAESNREATMQVNRSESGYTGAYPADYVTTCTGGNVVLTMPTTQTVVMENGHQQIVAPMVGYTANAEPSAEEPLRFHNVAGVLKVNVKNSLTQDLQIYALEIESSNAYIAGTGNVEGVDTPTPSLTISSDKTKNVMLMCNNTTLAQGNTADFYLVVAPFADATQFTVHVLATGATDNLKYTFHRESKSGITIARNQIGSISVDVNSTYTHTADEGNYFWGQGTADCPFIIACQADLERLRDLVNSPGTGFNYNANTVYYRQIADITLSSFSGAVGNSSHWFSANYDGGTHFVAGLNSCLFEYVGSTSTPACKISNVITKGSISVGNTRVSIGGIISNVKANTTLDNCTNEIIIKTNYSGNATSSSLYGHGGICGLIDAQNYTVKIINCTNTGNITRYYTCCGGICGSCNYGTITFDGCVNTGTITSNATAITSALGGIIGSALINSDPNAITIQSCTNRGNIVATAKDYSVGGIVGLCRNTCMKAPSITDCSNYGDITNAYKCGGIVGNFEKTNLTSGLTLSGTINNVGTISGQYFCGGIIGYSGSKIILDESSHVTNNAKVQYSGKTSSKANGSTTDQDMTSCGGIIGYTAGLTVNGIVTNTGNVVQSDGGTQYPYVGGIVGVCYNGDIVFNQATIKNEGVIVGTTHTGGLIGNCGVLTVTESTLTNIGNVTGTINVGGIAGYIYTETSTISNANNKGNITGSYDVGGIVGYGKVAEYFKCNNSGQISASSNSSSHGVAGIVGLAAQSTTLSQCLNTGTIICTTTSPSQSIYIGGLTGYTNVGLTINNCGNKGDIITEGGAWSMAGLCAMIRSASTITNSYSIGDIDWTNAPRCVGGLITTNANAILTNCYFGGEILGSGVSGNYLGELSGAYAGTTTISYSYSIHSYGGNAHATAYFNENTGNFASTTSTYKNKATLGEALRAWQEDNTTYTSWTNEAIPTLNLTF